MSTLVFDGPLHRRVCLPHDHPMAGLPGLLHRLRDLKHARMPEPAEEGCFLLENLECRLEPSWVTRPSPRCARACTED